MKRALAHRLLREDRGFTGAEKALLLTCALALILAVGMVLRRGAQQAGGDAARVLAAGTGAAAALNAAGGIGGSRALQAADALLAPAAAPVALGAVPLPQGLTDKAYDGAYVGAGGLAYPAGTPISQVPAVQPDKGEPSGTIIYINGISTTKAGEYQAMQALANHTGEQVIGVHDATQGLVTDLANSAKDKLDIGNDPAANTMSDTIYNALQAGQPITVMAHSRGALITSRALSDVQNRLRLEDGLSQAQAQARMGLIHVDTFGGAAWSYPDGPQYDHYVNRLDPVAMTLGVGAPGSNPGAGAHMHYFTSAVGGSVSLHNPFTWPPSSPISVKPPDVHGFQAVYLPHLPS